MKYMSMVGQLHWAITLGRYDILLAPKIGYLERMERLYDFL